MRPFQDSQFVNKIEYDFIELLRMLHHGCVAALVDEMELGVGHLRLEEVCDLRRRDLIVPTPDKQRRMRDAADRKSTRLNSSHVAISYAVFCLKNKTRGYF